MIQFNSFEPIIGKTPSAPYVGGTSPSYSDETSSKKSASKITKNSDKIRIGGLDDAMVKQLYDGQCLASDVANFMQETEEAIMNAYNPETGEVNINAYKILLPKLTMMRQSKEQFDKVYQKMLNDGTDGEIAVNTNGYVYVYSQLQGVHLVNPSKVTKDMTILTNGELAKIRAENPLAAFNNDYVTTIGNGISQANITKYIIDSLTKLGTTETSDNQAIDVNGSVIKGAKQLLDGLKKGYIQLDRTEKSQDQQAEYALNYILNTMPSNIKAILNVKAAQRSLNPVDIVKSLISSTLDTTENVKMSPHAGSKDSQSNKSSVKMEALVQYQAGMGGTPGREVINPGQSYALLVPGIKYSQILDKDGNPVKNGSLLDLRDSGLGSIGLMNRGIYVGNQLVSPTNYNQVAVQTGGMTRAWLPSVTESNGIEHPDFNLLKDFAKLNQELEQADSIAEKKSIIQQDPKFSKYLKGIDDEGNIQWDSSKFKPYYMVQAFASGETGLFGGPLGVINPSDLGGWGTEIEKMGISNEQTFMNDYIKDYQGPKKDIYSAIAYIPVNPSTSDALTASGQTPIMSEDGDSPLDIRVLEEKQNSKPGLTKLPQ